MQKKVRSELLCSGSMDPGDELPLNDVDEMERRLRGDVDLIVHSGSCGIEPTTVLDLTGDFPVVLREGRGSVEDFR